MASSCIAPYASCPETTNFARICRIVVDILRDILWQVLTHEVKPDDLPIQVSKHQYKLKSLDVKIKTWLVGISHSSSEIPSAEKFDVSSLYTLIRNLCSTIPTPTTQWGNTPPASGITLGDDIERIREFRNTLYGHATQAKIDTADFNNICTDINDVVSRFDVYFSANRKAMKCNFKSDIDTVLTCSMDKTLEDEYIEKLKEIVVLFDDVKEKVDDVGNAVCSAREEVTNLKHHVNNACQNVRDVQQDIDIARQKVNIVNQEVGNVKEEVVNVNRKVGDVEENVDNVKHDLLNVQKEVPKINQEVVDVKQEVGCVMQKVCEVMENVSDVRQEVGYSRQEVGSVKQEVTNVKQEVSSVTQTILDVKQDVSTVKQDVGSVKQDVGSVNREVGNVKREVGNVYQKVVDVKQNVGDVNRQVGDVKEAIGNVKKHVGDVKQHLKILQNEAGVKQQVGDVNTNLEILHDKVDVLKKDIAEIKDMIKMIPAGVEKGGTFRQDLQIKQFGSMSDDSNEPISLGKIPSRSSWHTIHEAGWLDDHDRDLKKQSLYVRKKVADVKQNVGEVKQEVDIVNQEVDIVKKEVGNVYLKVGDINQDVDNVKQEVSNVKQQAAKSNQKVDDVMHDVDNVKEEAAIVKQQFAAINQADGGVKQEVACTERKVTEVLLKVCDVKHEVGCVRQEVGNVKQEVGYVKQEITNVTQTICDVKQEVGNVRQEVGNVKQKVGSVKLEVGLVYLKLGDVEEDLGNFNQQVGNVIQDVRNVKQVIGDVEHQVDDVKQSVEILQKDAGVKKQVGDVNRNLEILHDKVDVLKKDIDEMKETLHMMTDNVEQGRIFGQDDLQNKRGKVSNESNQPISLDKIHSRSSQVDKIQSSEEMETHPFIQIPMDYGDDKQDNMTEDRICHLLTSESDLKAYISDDPPEACIKTLLSRASKQSDKESMEIILHYIVQQFTERFSEKHIRIWAGEEVIGPENVQTVLVCFYSGSFDISMQSFYDLKVIYREYNKTDGESALARAHEPNIKSDVTPEHCDLVNEAITIHGEGLFAKHSNLEAISSSGILSSNSRGLVQETCVILYCRIKGIIPFGEMPFPKRLKVNEEVSIAVDVREGYFSAQGDSSAQEDSSNTGQYSTCHHENQQLTEPLRMGCSVGPAGRLQSGTIGPFVKINSDRIGFLTCAHVVFSDSELIDLANIPQTDPIEQKMVQPPENDPSASHYQYNHRVCGKVLHAMFRGDWSPSSAETFGIDAAVIEITSRFPNAGVFVPIEQSQLEDAGFSLDQPPMFDTGTMMLHPINRKIQRAVIKIGSETGLTRGLLRLTKCMVRYSNRSGTLKRDNDRLEELTITMHGLMEISSPRFCTYGDSGAGVFLVDDDDNNKLICVGLSFGVMSDGTGLAMPIDKVLTALHNGNGLQIKLKEFEN